MSVAAGATVDVVASYQLGDGSSMPATDITVVINNPSIATVTGGAEGHATVRGVAVGTTTLTASGQGLTATATVTVTAAVLRSIAITPPAPSVAAGLSQQLTATGTFSDMTTSDLTAMVEWKSSADAKATVNAAGLLKGVAAGSATITAKLGTITGMTTATVTDAVLQAIEVTPPAPNLPIGITQQMTATGRLSDGTTTNLTTQVAWSSDAPGLASVTAAAGLVTAIAEGPAKITATKGAISGSTTVTVVAAVLVSIAITPPNASLAGGRTLQLTATGTFSDSLPRDLTDQVTWTSDKPEFVTVTSPGGLAKAIAPGTATITAALGAISGTTQLTSLDIVLDKIDVTPPGPTVAAGLSQQFVATGTFSDNSTQNLTDQVTWTSSNETVAQISNADGTRGLATTFVAGTATITATIGVISGSTTLTVTTAVLAKIEVAPINPSVALGRTLNFKATATFTDNTTQDLTTQVTWASDAPGVATVSNASGAEGVASTVSVGDANISATLANVTGSTKLTVTAAVLDAIEVAPPTPSIALGRTQQFTATGTFSDHTTQELTTQVTWASDTLTVATISNADGTKGLATSVGVGAAKISATLDGVTGSTTLTVTAAVLVSIQVTPVGLSVAAGTVVPYLATGTFSDNTTQDITTQVTWASTDPAVATISNADPTKGVATTLAAGTTSISATLDDVSFATTLTVTDAVLVSIQVEPIAPSLAIGRTLQFTATGRFTDNTTQDLTTQVTWASTDELFAAISNTAGTQGQATALAVGATTISATRGAVIGTTLLTVTPAALVSIAVTAETLSIAKGRTVQFTAIGTFTDQTTQDLTTQVTWASSNANIAQVSNAEGTQGLATGTGVGEATISATLAGVTGEAALTVTDAVLETITVAPANPSVAKGRTQQFLATGSFSDQSTLDITTQVTWASADTAVAQISNAAGSEGLATTLAVGSSAITATLGSVSGSSTLTVTDAELVSIAVTPDTASVVPGDVQQFAATGTFTDGTIQTLTDQVTWTAFDPIIASVSNVAATKGLATGLQVGSTAITASLGPVSGAATLTVLAPAVTVTFPRDGVPGIRSSAPIIINFNQSMLPASITVQTAAGPCSGTLQLSADGFATCVGFTGQPSFNLGATVANATPTALQATTTYRIRVLATVTNAGGSPMEATFTQTAGFATATAGNCATGLVISQIYGAGGNAGSVFRNDFIELHNGGSTPANLDGFAVQYGAVNGTSWQVTALPAVVVPPGGYFLIQESQGNAGSTAPLLPTPDFVATSPVIAMAAGAGKVALTSSTTALVGACDSFATTNDFIGYGAANCFEGIAVGVTAAATGALRGGNGCNDSNVNSADFTVATPTPRNGAATPFICPCQ